MNIIDYITTAALTGSEIHRDLANFAKDPQSEVFAVERGGVVVVCESEKVDQKIKAPKYSMIALGKLDKGYVKGSDKKEELVGDYIKLLSNDELSMTGCSSNLVEILRSKIEKLNQNENQPGK